METVKKPQHPKLHIKPEMFLISKLIYKYSSHHIFIFVEDPLNSQCLLAQTKGGHDPSNSCNDPIADRIFCSILHKY